MRHSDYPALDGRPVTQGHADICQREGHATHTVDGVDTGTCPRCGEVTIPNREPVATASPYYCRTYSATTRHIIKPGTSQRATLCGHRVMLTEEYLSESGELQWAEGWMIIDLPPCQRCESSAAKRGLRRGTHHPSTGS